MISHKMINPNNKIPNIKNILLVSSGKGGVGKSTVAVNLAISMQQSGLKVGLLDADIYGPSLPVLLGENEYKLEVENEHFIPLRKFDIQSISFGFLIDPNKAAIWRGAIVVKALKQMLFDSLWDDLDVLIIDMPPGTGDIHLSVAQSFPITANIFVTTPHYLAISDVCRSIQMYEQLNIPCLGFIQNMAYYECNKCENKDYIFGDKAHSVLTIDHRLNHLGDIPLSSLIAQHSEQGTPDVLLNERTKLLYENIVTDLLSELQLIPKARKNIIPQVVAI